MLKPQETRPIQRQNVLRRMAKKVALNLISILGRGMTGRNPWISKLNSIDSSAAKVRYVQKVCQEQSERNSDFSVFLNTAGVASHKWLGDGPDKDFVGRCIANLPIEQINEQSVRRAERLNVPLRASFRVSLTLRSKKKELFTLSEWRLDDKRAGSRYAERVGVRSPALLQDGVRLDEIDFKNSTVVKPSFGAASTGVYIITGNGEIICVKESRLLSGKEELQGHAQKLIEDGFLQHDEWQVEELFIGVDGKSGAADIKCYTFYGRTELVIYMQRYPSLQSSWFDREGNQLDNTGVEWSPRLMAAVSLADRIGGTIPAPFIRIDLLEGKDDIVFGEFTPRPGPYCDFDAELDARLGVAFLDAEERLLEDLLCGKKFPEYSAEFDIGRDASQ